ncbi:hypothetical protein DAPPUDRAFT_331305 [Daphnia pulex]|uniref:Uncharacterized protein n=1 Tax=Daphnia pulex TaxID=6669 RepID=E9HM32_DAPPU|nr:hypothetical protein DAPPUDRAFT_331305 [Daphnia pulex]|eukprot:EFX67211.1 hypothetical protein DAPPUDRAFT_331305 [Daphnia pulex]
MGDKSLLDILGELSDPDVLVQYLIIQETTNPLLKKKFRTCQSLPILREIDLESKIVQVETHRQGGKLNTNNSTEPFVVFKTFSEKDGDSWWSFEKSLNDIIIQRSRDKDEVKNQLKGEKRQGTSTYAEDLEGKGCMRQLLTLLWIHMIVDAKYQRHLSRCESIMPLVMKKITKIGYEYESNFTYSALSAEERNPELSDFIDFLFNVSNWHPLKNTYGLRDKIIDCLKEKDGGVIKEYLSLKQAKFDMQIFSWKRIVWRPLAALTVPSLTWKENQPKLFLVPHADVKPGKGGEISEPALIRLLANEENIKQPNSAESQAVGMLNMLSVIDHCSNITKVHLYQSNGNNFMLANLISAVHTFIVFQTTSDKDGVHWWSLDRKADYIVLQRSRSLDAVKNKFGSQERKNVKCNIQDLVGKGSIKKLLTILWIHQVMEEFNPNKSSNRQSFVTLVSEAITFCRFSWEVHDRAGSQKEWVDTRQVEFGLGFWPSEFRVPSKCDSPEVPFLAAIKHKSLVI